MSELYHLHLKGIHDNKWKEKKEITIDKDFNNRLSKKVNTFNNWIQISEIEQISKELAQLLRLNGFETLVPFELILDLITNPNLKVSKNVLMDVLLKFKTLMHQAAILKRETAMESSRKENNPNLPSRQHCIYATTENGINYWKNRIIDGDIEIFRIETMDEPFKTSEILIPNEYGTLNDIYTQSYKYWNPKFKNIPEESMEYLIKGKIKVLEKVDEIRKLK